MLQTCKGLLDKLLASSAPQDAEVIAATFWEVDDLLPDSMRRVRSLSITPATFFHARALELSTQTAALELSPGQTLGHWCQSTLGHPRHVRH